MRALLLAAVLLVGCRTGAPAAPPPAPAPPPPAHDDDMGGMPAGKRAGPPDVAPVTVGRVVIRAIPWGRQRGWGQNGGYIGAYDGDRELWTLQVYPVAYDPKLEEDVQDVFIETLVAGPGASEVTVTDERGHSFRVDVQTRKVAPAP
jgi:hypothetical protein